MDETMKHSEKRTKHLEKMDRAKKLIKQGYSIIDIATKLGYNRPKSLYYALRKQGIKPINKKPNFSNTKIKEYIDRHLAGETLSDMAKKDNVAATWVSQLMRRKFGYSVKDKAFNNKPHADNVDSYNNHMWECMLYGSIPLAFKTPYSATEAV